MNRDAPVALVTGGAVRVGRATVERLAQAGWQVAFTYHSSAAAARELEKRLAGQASSFHVALHEHAGRSALVAKVSDRFGRLDALVNNAAVFPRTPLAEVTQQGLRDVMAVNLEAPLFLTLACAPLLRSAQGAVVNIVDIYARFPLRNYLPYSVSKAALVAVTRALAVELAPDVRVNAVAPGVAMFPEDYDPETRRRLLDRTLLKREGGAEEIAAAVHHLIAGTHTTTGQVLTIDGGRTLAL